VEVVICNRKGFLIGPRYGETPAESSSNYPEII